MGGICLTKEKAPALDLDDKVKFMTSVNCFSKLTAAESKKLADVSKTASYGKNVTIYHEGDYGADLYIIASGMVAVHFEGDKSDLHLGPGDHFGEGALLRDAPRRCTVKTETAVEVLLVNRKQFEEMNLDKKMVLEKRRPLNAARGVVKIEEPSVKTEEDVKLLINAIRTNKGLGNMLQLDEEQCKMMCDAAWERKAAAGETVIEQGSQADYFYVVKEGLLEIDILVEGDKAKDQKNCHDAIVAHMQQVGTVAKGSSFGESALLLNIPRSATVKAIDPSVLWVIDRMTFKKGCARKADYYAKKYAEYLKVSDQFAGLPEEKLMEVAKAMLESNFSKGDVIFSQGEEGTSFYILYDGEVSASQDNKELVRLKVGPGTDSEIFGDVALANGDVYETTMTVVSEVAKTLTMDKDSFEMLLGPIAALKGGRKDSDSLLKQSSYAAAVQEVRNQGREQIYYNDLKTIGLLGCGGFGYVNLVEDTVTQNTYAMKSLSKGFIVQQNQQTEVMMEKNIQSRCDSDFIVRLYETYTGEQSLFLLLELGLGGELYHTYQTKGFWGSEPHAKYYTAGVVFAFEHMHRKKMIYRDLKPENILFNNSGHSKLTDMGLATICLGKTFTTCGTAPYMAPEVIAASGHNHAVDWWTLGLMTYELMTGHSPFEANTQVQIFGKINQGITQVVFPVDMLSSLKLYVKAMCKDDPAERLAMKKGGIENIKKHAWYEGFDWVAMRSQTLTPPYVPAVSGSKDLTNFQSQDDEKPPQVEYKDDGSGWDKDFATSTFERPAANGKNGHE